MPEPDETIDTSAPHSARMYDYYLGGKDWFAADREAAEQILGRFPMVRTLARTNRAFMRRATRTLAGESGVRQFLDLGSGIPTKPNLHQVAQAERPDARVVYVDNDPLVIEYADALLRSTPEGRTAYLEADVRREDVLQHPQVREVLDFDEPVALSLVAVAHFLADTLDPWALVGRLVAELPAGSYLVLSHATYEVGATDEENAENRDQAGVVEEIYRSRGTEFRLRGRAEIARFFDGLALLEPGLVIGHRWRPDEEPQLRDDEVSFFAGVARKP